jgi:hypothetical protein
MSTTNIYPLGGKALSGLDFHNLPAAAEVDKVALSLARRGRGGGNREDGPARKAGKGDVLRARGVEGEAVAGQDGERLLR